MPLWDTNTFTFPKYLNREDKRNVVATKAGYVRLKKVTGTPDETLIAANNLHLKVGTTKVSDVWHSVSTIKKNNPVKTTLSFDHPIQNLGGSVKIAVANTISGGAVTAEAPALTVASGNQLEFTWTPTVAGTYKVQAQTASNGSATAVSVRTNDGANSALSIIVSGAASNTAGTVVVTN